MIQIIADNKEIPVNRLEFSDGALAFKLDQLPEEEPEYININVCPSTPVKNVREEINLVVDCIEEYYNTFMVDLYTKITLNLPYLPYGRADRVFEVGNGLPLNVFISEVVMMGFDNVQTVDAHNPESLRGTPIKNIEQFTAFGATLDALPREDVEPTWDLVVAPDKGSVKKAEAIAAGLDIPIGFASKTRDVSTGKITGFTVPDACDIEGQRILIPDDICDYGNTFIGLAKALKNKGAKSVDLYVTHMIGAGGFSRFKGIIDKIYCYHCVGTYVNKKTIQDYNDGLLSQ